MKCRECGKTYKGLNGLSVHVTKSHEMDKESYYARHGERPECACGCGGTPSFVNIRDGFKTYVHGHHPGWNAGKTFDTDDRLRSMGESISEAKAGVKIGRQSEWVICECKNPECGRTIESPPSLEGHKKYCEDACRESHTAALRRSKRNDTVACTCKRCRRVFQNRRDLCGKLRVRPCCDECLPIVRAEATARMNREIASRIPSTEKKVMRVLDAAGIEYEHSVRIGRYVVDFVVGETVVECYGDYWHCNPDTFDPADTNETTGQLASDVWDRDEERLKYIRDRGYRTAVLWESDISDGVTLEDITGNAR
jgi:G:T-mismatch repair DNA endonuclease (very short patch repair protein)